MAKAMKFGIGGEIPEHAVGSILAAYVRAGIDWKSLAITPIVPPAEIIEGEIATLPQTQRLALPAPDKKYYTGGAIPQFVLKLLKKAPQTIFSREKIVTKTFKRMPAISESSLDQALTSLSKTGKILRVGVGQYRANPAAVDDTPTTAKKKSHTKPKTVVAANGNSHRKPRVTAASGKRGLDIILNAITLANPELVSRSTLKAALSVNGFSERTVDGGVAKLVDNKQVKRAGDGMYGLSNKAKKLLAQQQHAATATEATAN